MMTTPITLEVISPLPTAYFHCTHCEQVFDQAGLGKKLHDPAGQYPPEFLEESHRLAVWLEELSARYGSSLSIRVVDPQSPLGFFKSLRHWVRRYPTFIVNGQEKYTGWDQEALEAILQSK
jgi:hypothetical protein